MLKYVEMEKEDIVLPSLKSDELVRLAFQYNNLEDAMNSFRKKIFTLQENTAMAIVYDNKIIDYTDYPGKYFWLGTETKFQSCNFSKFLLFNISEYEKKIENVLDDESVYVYIINLNNLNSFPLYIENPVVFNDIRYGELRVRIYCSFNSYISNPFLLLFRAAETEVLTSENLFKNKYGELYSIFCESIKDFNEMYECTFENLKEIEKNIQSIILPKIFSTLHENYGIHVIHININSILPDSNSRDLINEADKIRKRN